MVSLEIDFPTEIPVVEPESPPSTRVELLLLYLGGLFTLSGYISLTLLRPGDWPTHLLVVAAWAAAAWVGRRILNRYLPQRDLILFPLVMFFSGWGLIMVRRLAPRFGERQTLWLLVGVAAMLLVVVLPQIPRWLRAYRYVWLFSGLTLLVATIVWGKNPSGIGSAPQLWLGLGNVYFQPSELLKIVLVVFLSSYLAEQYPLLRTEALIRGSRWRALSPRIVGPIMLMWGMTFVILVWQRDLGTAILFFAVFIVLLYVSSGYMWVLAGGSLLVVLAAIIAYRLFDVVSLRIDIWLNPWPDADGRAYQLVQSLQAFASGGIFGQGVGQGHPGFIPVVHSDFVFAALAEEWGLLGVVVVVAGVTILLVRGLETAVRQQGRAFHTLLAVGLTMMLTVQSILIMGGVVRLLPLTGVTFPFLSYGGSSLVISFIMIGLLLRLSDPEGARF